jgi:hypothetical protein
VLLDPTAGFGLSRANDLLPSCVIEARAPKPGNPLFIRWGYADYLPNGLARNPISLGRFRSHQQLILSYRTLISHELWNILSFIEPLHLHFVLVGFQNLCNPLLNTVIVVESQDISKLFRFDVFSPGRCSEGEWMAGRISSRSCPKIVKTYLVL